jgi:predicted nucleic acid-binding protein
LITADSSVAIAAFASWHEHHEAAHRALDNTVVLVEHCALETYSVLTRLPAPHRSPPAVVRDYIDARFPRPFLRLEPHAYRLFLAALADNSVAGGASYDALVAATAVSHGAELLTCDPRAATLYERYRVRTRFIG